jgi:hypothetical protein
VSAKGRFLGYATAVVRRIALGPGIAGVVCVLYALVACSSLPDLHFDDGEGGVGGEGGVVGEGGVGEGGDGSFSCKTTSGFSCQDAVADWTPVLFAPSGQPSCPSGTSGIDLKVAAGDASPTCACSCNAAGGSCTSGNFTVTSSAEATCAVTPSTTNVPVSGGCSAINGGSFAVSTDAMIAPPAGPTACTPTGAPAASLTSGRLCQVTGTGTGCTATQSCAPKSSSGLQSCVTKSGSSACPVGFSKRSTAGTSAVDNRTCTGCACAPPTPCSGGSVSLYDNQMCKAMGGQHGAEDITGACSPAAPSSGFTATHYKSTPPTGGGCGAPTNQGTAAGTVDFQNERTICCK